MNLQNTSMIGVAVALSVLIAYLISGGRGDDLQFVLHNINAVQEDMERLHKKVDEISQPESRSFRSPVPRAAQGV